MSDKEHIWIPRLKQQLADRRIGRREFIRYSALLGMSAGAALVATCRVMRRDGPGVYVTVLPDGGLKYLSQPLFALDAEFEARSEDV